QGLVGSEMCIRDSVMRMKDFIRKDPRSVYVLSTGTDSQVNQNVTKFMTAIPVSYTHLTLPTMVYQCRARGAAYH
ncbi:ribonuclease H-like YkuK family protein, partial [Bacillus pumilus]|uniref:ribonuclease H-like YkuK family protein n=1 Tax=Bacillus pumilus TaxID=1408 RepID=UPI0021C40482